jgi:hypothetical protein
MKAKRLLALREQSRPTSAILVGGGSIIDAGMPTFCRRASGARADLPGIWGREVGSRVLRAS